MRPACISAHTSVMPIVARPHDTCIIRVVTGRCPLASAQHLYHMLHRLLSSQRACHLPSAVTNVWPYAQ